MFLFSRKVIAMAQDQGQREQGTGFFGSLLYNAIIAFVAFYLIRQVINPSAPAQQSTAANSTLLLNGIPEGYELV